MASFKSTTSKSPTKHHKRGKTVTKVFKDNHQQELMTPTNPTIKDNFGGVLSATKYINYQKHLKTQMI